MKKILSKFLLLSVLLSIANSSLLLAREDDQQERRGPRNEEKFSEIKADMLSNLGQEKTAIEQTIACVNSTQKMDDLEKCREIKRSSMDKLREANKAKHKQRLEQELKELNEQQTDSSSKGGFQKRNSQNSQN